MKKLLLLGLGAYALYYLTQNTTPQTPPPSPPNPPVRNPSGADLNLEVSEVEDASGAGAQDDPLL